VTARLARTLALPFVATLDALCVLGVPPRPREDGRRVVLVVRLDAIGDFLLWTRSALDLLALYPPATHRRVLVANRAWAGLARDLGAFDEILELDRDRFDRDLAYRAGMLHAIRQLGADVCIQPTFSREFRYGDAVVRASGARERIGSEGDLSNQRGVLKAISDRAYTRRIPAAPGLMPELERNAEFVRGLGAATARAGLPVLGLSDERPAGLERGAYYVIVPGAGSALRRWPLERFAALASRIHERSGLRGLVCGSAAEEHLGRRLVALGPETLENRAGATSLDQLCRIVRDARFVVTNETSAVHIAAAFTTPVVCVVGGGHFGRFVPYPEIAGARLPATVVHPMDCFGCNWRCIYAVPEGDAAPCMTNVSLEAVWAQVETLLAESRA
jgi:ADP-heptose:LPS heptosyltransferase